MPKKSASPTPLSLDRFREMDYLAVEEYSLPIALMMENAGLQLARLIARTAKPGEAVVIGCGKGNNGGGGLVAARRLAAWGYRVYLDLPGAITEGLPAEQLQRALAFGAKQETSLSPAVWVDAYLGFSQRLPLRGSILEAIHRANATDTFRISLDIPTGVTGPSEVDIFQAHQVLTLAAYKEVLVDLPPATAIYMADLGIPRAVYEKFGVEMPPFATEGIVPVLR